MKYDVSIIGGGIVGLATALQILKLRPQTKLCVIEKEQAVAQHQTGHNSGVIHSGIYYKPNSLKALNCIRGYQMLLDFCQQENIGYELCGKIIVATEQSELATLENVYQRGIANGLDKIKKISKEEIKEIEPHCQGIAGIYVPYTGIIDYVEVAQKYAQLIREKGGQIFLGKKVEKIQEQQNNYEIITQNRTYASTLLINCAGLYSDKITQLTQKKVDYRIIPFRGEYYHIKPEKQYLVKHLIYPVPDPNFPFLGVHFTRMIKGGVEAGPNAVFSFKKEGYKKTDFDFQETIASISWRGFQKVAFKYWKTGLGEFYRSFSKTAFTKALQRLIPEIQENDLEQGGAGVRAQACDRNGGLIDDFLIIENKGIIHVGNAPSPAATSSLSIGLTVAEMAVKKF
ncbi:L-2-hydroxyglutarate oxidase [Thermoflexibacter ruber]|uniref:L-2-hydroxyglutarate oxidase n=1 Tax=Thermoflexibacter ruber TaxID=1003 RepID=A0A1I2F0B9_9BACT|nr:L-2-hydroxyglutarate oxidase [Thermoflexibacter ruber]SFE98595.1 L-2-hydroxyglutarate oxidase [Thermoflexibacter ruber]